jgi:DNA-directed RNA polymerase subunit M/transcription elongation factor TFIIS
MSTKNLINILKKYSKKSTEKLEIIEKKISQIDDKKILYNILNELYNNVEIRDIVKRLDKKQTSWNNPVFYSFQKQINEQNEFIKKPFEVEEGVLECSCGSKKVFSYSKQTRSADEPMTTFAECIMCKKKWTYSG